MPTEAIALSGAARRILDGAIHSPGSDRFCLIDGLIVSIPPPDAPTEEGFRAMLRQRVDDFDAGVEVTISEEEMDAELNREFGEL